MLRKMINNDNKHSSCIFFWNVFNDSPFSSTFFLFLATAWNSILFYCFDIYQVQFETSKTNSSMCS